MTNVYVKNESSLNRNLRVFLENIEKYAQDFNSQQQQQQEKPTSAIPKFNKTIKPILIDITTAISDLNAAKSLINPNESKELTVSFSLKDDFEYDSN